MVTAGKYSVWFKTPIGEAAGVVELVSDGSFHGGDSTFSYAGQWKQDKGRFQAVVSAKRTSPGPPGVFALDDLDLTLAGRCDDGGLSVSCTGLAKQSPGLSLEVTLLRMPDD